MMVGVFMVQEKIVYENNGFVIVECNRMKHYDDPLLQQNDRVYRIRVTGTNQPTFDDICELLYYLLKNKIYYGAFVKYKDMVLNSIKRAENERNKKTSSNNTILFDYMKN